MAKNRTFKDAVDTRLSSVVLSSQMKENIRSRTTGTEEAPKRKKPIRWRRAFLSAVAACLVLVFGVAAAASVFPGFETFISRVGEDVRQLVQPVNLDVTQAGIRMEVIAAVHDGDTAVAYLSLQDMEGDRIDESTELYACGFGSSNFSFGQMVYYDAETRTATFRLERVFADDPSQNKVTVTVNSILSGTYSFNSVDTGLTLASIKEANPTPQTLRINTVGSVGMSHGADEAQNQKLWASLDTDSFTVLSPEEPINLEQPSGITLTGAGVVDDMLHVQHSPQGMERYSYLDLFLDYPGASGETLLPSAYIEFGDVQQADDRDYYSHTEYIFPLPQNVPDEEVRLLASGQAYHHYIPGNWQVTFVLDKNPPQLQAECDIDMNPWNLYKVTLSTVGITMYGRGEPTEYSDYADAVITMKNGETVEYSGGTRWVYEIDGTFTIKNSFALPINLDEVQSVTINGHPVVFNR